MQTLLQKYIKWDNDLGIDNNIIYSFFIELLFFTGMWQTR